MDGTAAIPRPAHERCLKFLQAFGQAVKLISLYKANHPIPAASMQEAWNLLHDLLAETGWPEAVFALVGGRWTVNEVVVAESARAYEILAMVFRSHALETVTFLPETRLFEFAALCEMAATPPNQAYATDAGEFLKQRGVRNIRVNVEEFVRKRKVSPLATPIIQRPTAPPRPAPAPPAPKPAPAAPRPGLGPGTGTGAGAGTAPGAGTGPGTGTGPGGRGFGSFIKSLIDESVANPDERAKLYTEALRLVEQALERHVSEATHKLLLEKQGILNERLRTETVLAKVADGKVIVDKEGRVLMMDPTAEEIAGKPFVEVAGKPLLESLGDGEQIVALSKDLILPENGPLSEDVSFSGGSDALEAFRQSMALVQDESGRTVGTYAVLPYVTKYREAMKLQEEFIANITHDLKAPLASICSALELINEKARGKLNRGEAEFLDISLRNSRTLSQMISEILDFSKIRSGRMTVTPAPGAVDSMIQGAVEALRPWATTKGLTLEFQDPDAAASLPMVSADHNRVVQIINNLLSNSIKCTAEGGRVGVSAALGKGDDGGSVVVTVTDTGCGIAPTDQQRIFEKFHQIAPPGSRREGVGLGLAIVKELVTRHKGRLWLDSEVGKGTSFHFTLPLAETAVEAAETEPGSGGLSIVA